MVEFVEPLLQHELLLAELVASKDILARVARSKRRLQRDAVMLHLHLNLSQKRGILTDRVVIVPLREDHHLAEAIVAERGRLVAVCASRRLDETAHRHVAPVKQHEVRGHAGLRAVGDPAHHLRVPEHEDRPLRVDRVDGLEDVRELACLAHVRVPPLPARAAHLRAEAPQLALDVWLISAPHYVRARDDDRNSVRVLREQSERLLLDVAARRDGGGRRIEAKRTRLLRRVVEHTPHLVVEVQVARGKLAIVEEDRLAFSVLGRKKELHADVLGARLSEEEVARCQLIRLVHSPQDHEDGEQRRRDLELQHRALASQRGERPLHLDLVVLARADIRAAGAVEVVGLVDDEHEMKGLVVLEHRGRARIHDGVACLQDLRGRVVADDAAALDELV
mmetsp:Transcript_1873/g.3977  ORF Transcript_1873/g.3977 Transcript_1873/m.3977 type:complete len:393 (-) Transcript_1873:199-1377(-)